MRNQIEMIIFLLFCFSSINAQEKLLGILPLSNGKVSYSGVETVTGTNMTQLQQRAIKWFQPQEKDASRSIISKTEEKILGKGKYKIRARGVGLVGYDMEILYRIEISFNSEGYNYLLNEVIGTTEGKFDLIEKPIENWNDDFQNEERRNSKNQKVYPQVDEGMREVIESLKAAMNGK
ncbi:hypothetical protein [Namhaeicola litoreus]|uniref:DUF4468 domain-containing protein n=1 Tax=Namhaeicola litoreus TaxID=1052145 RepID=A0ABW3Y3K4_9FLAO